jgi:hypothetical protein
MNKNSRKHLQEVLDKDLSCYVLITCGQPSEDGQMQVEMTYQGDAALAAYLLQGAQFFIDKEELDVCSLYESPHGKKRGNSAKS